MQQPGVNNGRQLKRMHSQMCTLMFHNGQLMLQNGNWKALARLEEKQAQQEREIGTLKEKQAQQERKNEQLESQNEQLKSQNGTLAKEVEELKTNLEAAKHAILIGVPTVVNLENNYDLDKLLTLIQHGSAATDRIYIPRNQNLKNGGLIPAIVELMISAEKPEKMIKEVTVESGHVDLAPHLDWPYSLIWRDHWEQINFLGMMVENVADVKFLGKAKSVAIKFNEASASPTIEPAGFKAAYVVSNSRKSYVRFKLDIYYAREEHFEKRVAKFVYHRLEVFEEG